MIPVTLDIWTQFFDYTQIITFPGFESVIISFIIGILIAVILRHVLGLAVALGALVGILILVGAASFSLAAFSTLAQELWTFLSGYSGAIQKVVLGGGIDAIIALVIGLALGYFGLPGIAVHSD